MLEKRAPSSLLLILILDTPSLMMMLSSRISYKTTTLAIAGEMLRPCSSLSHDINTIALNMHPRTSMRLAQLQQPGRCLFLALVYPFFNLFLTVLKNLENMVNVKCYNLTGIEAWTYGLIV